MRRLLAVLIVVFVVPILLMQMSPASPDVTAAPSGATSPSLGGSGGADASIGAQPVATHNTSKGFRDRSRLEEHFAKHGREFGDVSEAQYLAMAQTLYEASVGGDVLEIVRASDGVISRFDKRTGAFGAYDRDGTIRTFFKPNDGEQYFRRQANRPRAP